MNLSQINDRLAVQKAQGRPVAELPMTDALWLVGEVFRLRGIIHGPEGPDAEVWRQAEQMREMLLNFNEQITAFFPAHVVPGGRGQ